MTWTLIILICLGPNCWRQSLPAPDGGYKTRAACEAAGEAQLARQIIEQYACRPSAGREQEV